MKKTVCAFVLMLLLTCLAAAVGQTIAPTVNVYNLQAVFSSYRSIFTADDFVSVYSSTPAVVPNIGARTTAAFYVSSTPFLGNDYASAYTDYPLYEGSELQSVSFTMQKVNVGYPVYLQILYHSYKGYGYGDEDGLLWSSAISSIGRSISIPCYITGSTQLEFRITTVYTPVPEPSAVLTLFCGVCGVGGMGWTTHRRRRQA